MSRIMVTGSGGYVGSTLVPLLRDRYGADNVLATIFPPGSSDNLKGIHTEVLDVTDQLVVKRKVEENDIDIVYHLAAVLSSKAEAQPDLAWAVNMQGLRNVLEVCRTSGVSRLFWPSSIAVFGPDAQRRNTPQGSALNPTTNYGITKVAGELLGNYYFHRYGLDVRSLRYPGLVSGDALPGGGTTDFAVLMFHSALQGKTFSCFLREDTRLPMMYIKDAMKAAIEVMEADPDRIRRHSAYNISALSFSARELDDEIRKHVPSTKVTYIPDSRQAIADSWPESIDDSEARNDWGWSHAYSLGMMVEDMLLKLEGKPL